MSCGQIASDEHNHQYTVIYTNSEIDTASGGVLLNVKGELIGLIIPRKQSSDRSAVAINVIRDFLQQTTQTSPHSVSVPPVPSPQDIPYQAQWYGKDIVKVYQNEAQPTSPDQWLVYIKPGQQLAYLAVAVADEFTKTDKATKKINMVAIPNTEEPSMTLYFDTNCNGLVDMVGYTAGLGETLEWLEVRDDASRVQSLLLASLAPELVNAVKDKQIKPRELTFCGETATQ